MKEAPRNPSANRFGPGVTEDQVRDAVGRSGYPLQTRVAQLLRNPFHVHEEWAYRDRESSKLRALDIRAEHFLYPPTDQNPRVRPRLTLLVECKKSDLPLVFFGCDHPFRTHDHPKLTGLRSKDITVFSDDTASTHSLPVLVALGLVDHPFQEAPVYCNTFSKCARKGKDLELSGTEAYAGLVLPLIKALDHLAEAEAPGEGAHYFDAHLSVGLGVIDAPMLHVLPGSGEPELELVPWVRVLRHEYDPDGHRYARDRVWEIDIVHCDFLETYLTEHLLPFATDFGTKVLGHTEELATGKAFVSGMEGNPWTDIEGRLTPMGSDKKASYGGAVARHLLGLLRRG